MAYLRKGQRVPSLVGNNRVTVAWELERECLIRESG